MNLGLPPRLNAISHLLWNREHSSQGCCDTEGGRKKQHPTGCFSNIHYFPAKKGQPLTPINLRRKVQPPAGRGYLKKHCNRNPCAQVLLSRNPSWARERSQQQTQMGSAWGAHWPQVWAPLAHSEHETPGSQGSIAEQLN